MAPLQMSHWTSPPETDVGVLMAQFRAVMSEEISASSSPFLFEVASGHLKAFITNETESEDLELKKLKQFLTSEVKKSSLTDMFF